MKGKEKKMGITRGSMEEKRVPIGTLKPGDTFQTHVGSVLWLVTDWENEDEGFAFHCIDLLSGKTDTFCTEDVDRVIPIELVVSEKKA